MDGEPNNASGAMAERVKQEIEILAARHVNAGGALMSLILSLGKEAENALEKLPDRYKDRLEKATLDALVNIYQVSATVTRSSWIPATRDWAQKILVVVSGGAGGFGGLPSALIELPITISTMFAAIQHVAREHGLDPDKEDVRLECLRVFACGSPLPNDDGVDVSFLTTKMVVTGPMVQTVLRNVAPALAARLAQKLAAQTVPILGSAIGATINYAFLSYFLEMAKVRFGLIKIAQELGDAETAVLFSTAVKERQGRRPNSVLR